MMRFVAKLFFPVFVSIGLASQAACQTVEQAPILVYPKPTASMAELFKPLGSQEATTKPFEISYQCLQAIELSIDVYNIHSKKNYETYKEQDEHNLPQRIFGKNEMPIKISCSHYPDHKTSVYILLQSFNPIHVIFDKDLNVLSWASGDINQP